MSESSVTGQFSPRDGLSKTYWLQALGVSLATALVVISPFFWLGNASGHDFSFHAASWMDAAGQWREGIFYPRWNQGANFGFGEPRFIFYPPLSWMLGAGLGLIFPWEDVPGIFIVLSQTLAGLSAFALARRLVAARAALMAAFCYAANPYALLIVYMRSDFAEQLAMVFFPLVFLAALRVLGLLEEPAQPGAGVKSYGRSIAELSMVFAAVWLTNAPAAVIATYTLGLLCCYAAWRKGSAKPLFRGLGAIALGFGLAGVYLIPAIYEQRWVNISQALSSGLQPAQNFLYSVIDDAEHNAFNHIASSTAVLMVVLVVILGAVAELRDVESSASPSRKAIRAGLWMIVAVAFFLMLPISDIFWRGLPELRFVQFPWRWMSIVAVPLGCFAALVVEQKLRSRLMTMLAVAAIVAVLGGAAGYMVRHTWWDTEDIPVLLEAINKDEGFEGVDEYDPEGDDHSSLPEKAPKVALLPASEGDEQASDPRVGAKIYIERWSAERRDLRVSLRAPANLSLRLLNYPAWRIKVNSAEVAAQQLGETNEMILPLAAGDSQIQIDFGRTRDRTVGGALSGCSVLVVLWMFSRRSSKEKAEALREGG